MRILSIICGIIMALFGVSLTFTPITTFLSTGYFFAIMLLVSGIIGIINGFVSHKYSYKFIFSVISAVLGIIMAIAPITRFLAEGMLLNIMAIWFILQGIISIIIAVKNKNVQNKTWILKLILGIVGLLIGIFTFIHPIILAVALGILIGIYFIESGISMIITSNDN